MASVNKVILVGRLGKDPEAKGAGTVVTCSLATSRKSKNKQGEYVSETEWHNLVFFKKNAENALKFLKKGSQLYVEGEIKTDHYEKNGEKRQSKSILVNMMQFLDSKEQEDKPNNTQSSNDTFDEDVPF